MLLRTVRTECIVGTGCTVLYIHTIPPLSNDLCTQVAVGVSWCWALGRGTVSCAWGGDGSSGLLLAATGAGSMFTSLWFGLSCLDLSCIVLYCVALLRYIRVPGRCTQMYGPIRPGQAERKSQSHHSHLSPSCPVIIVSFRGCLDATPWHISPQSLAQVLILSSWLAIKAPKLPVDSTIHTVPTRW